MLRMDVPTADGRQELERHLEGQMRAQERQLVWVRLGMALVAALLLSIFAQHVEALPVLLALLGVVAVSTLAIPLLLTRFPAREVGIVSTALDMAAVTVAVYTAGTAIDAYLFYGIVILGTALRFGLGASIWSSVVMSGMYVAVVLATTSFDDPVRRLLAAHVAYLISAGVVTGLFSRIVIGRATDNARLLQRLDEEERDREHARERELVSRLGRDFAASLDRDTTTRTIISASAPLLGDVSLVYVVDDASQRLEPVAHGGNDDELAQRWRAHAAERRPRLGEGIAGGAAATIAAVEGARDSAAPGDPDGMSVLELAWVLAVPIVAGGRLFGVLATAGSAGTPPPSERLRRMAEAVADRAGPALQNAQLWSDLQDRMTREQAAQRIKDDFLSIVSHELRTPLTSIQGYSQLLEARLRTNRAGESKEMAHVRVIRSQVGRMRRLVDDLLDVGRIDRRGAVSIETVDFDLAEQIHEAVARIRGEHRERHIDVRVPEAIGIHADRDRIDQVLSNLLENAVKYSPDGGPITVTAEPRGGEIDVRVADVGIGIPDEHRENVFERFYQADGEAGRRRGGLGLGLYISRAIIDAHGGRIWSAPNTEAGRGSVFGFRIPRVAMPLASAGIVPTGEPPPFVVRRRDG